MISYYEEKHTVFPVHRDFFKMRSRPCQGTVTVSRKTMKDITAYKIRCKTVNFAALFQNLDLSFLSYDG